MRSRSDDRYDDRDDDRYYDRFDRRDDYDDDRFEEYRDIRRRRRRPPPSSGNGKVWAVLFLVCVFTAMIGGIVFIGMNANNPPDDDSITKELQQDRPEVVAAFAAAVEPTAEQDATFRPVLEKLFDACKNKDRGAIIASYDPERTVRECKQLGLIRPMSPREYRAFSTGFAEGMRSKLPDALLGNVALGTVSEIHIRSVRSSADGSEAVVIAKVIFGEGDDAFPNPMRFWLIRKPEGWKIYDQEDLMLGQRFTAATGAALGFLESKQGEFNPIDMGLVTQAFNHLQAGEVADAEQALKLARKSKFKLPLFLALREVAEGLLALQQEDPKKARGHFDAVDRIYPEMPLTLFGRITADIQLEDFETAIKNGEKYRAALGHLAMVELLIGTSHEALDNDAAAAVAYGHALDDEPDNEVALEGLSRTVQKGGMADFPKRLQKSKHRNTLFQTLRGMTFRQDDAEARAALVAEYIKLCPKEPEAISAALDLAFENKKPEDALALYQRAFTLSGQDRRDAIQSVVNAMAFQGEILAAYRATPAADAGTVFRHAVQALVDDDEDDLSWITDYSDVREGDLRDLIALRATMAPDDLWIDYAQGRLVARREDWAGAERHYTAAEKKVPAVAKEERETIRYHHATALLQLGRQQEGYERFGKTAEAFELFANRMVYDDTKLTEFGELVQRYQKDHPEHANRHYWTGTLAWNRKDYAGATKELQEHLKNDKPMKPVWSAWSSRDRLLRSLVRSGRIADAAKLLEADDDNDDERPMYTPNHRILVLLAEGKTDAAADLIRNRAEESPWSVVWLYRDEDIGTWLAKPACAAIRKEFRETAPYPNLQPSR